MNSLKGKTFLDFRSMLAVGCKQDKGRASFLQPLLLTYFCAGLSFFKMVLCRRILIVPGDQVEGVDPPRPHHCQLQSRVLGIVAQPKSKYNDGEIVDSVAKAGLNAKSRLNSGKTLSNLHSQQLSIWHIEHSAFLPHSQYFPFLYEHLRSPIFAA